MNPNARHPRRRLLIVDNDHDMADSLCVWIRLRTAWITVAAYGAEQAVDLVRDEPFDAVLLDLTLPGSNGLDMASRLENANKLHHPAIVALTGDWDLRDTASSDDRFAASLLKPADSHRLLALLADIDTTP